MATSWNDDPVLAWQRDVWDRMSDVYVRHIDRCFAPVVDAVIRRAGLHPGHRVLDIGTGTGSVAIAAARRVAPDGNVVGTDVSPEMLAIARARASDGGLGNVTFEEGRGEAIDAPDASFDVVLASLSLMYVIDRSAAAREIARVLRPAGRFVAAVWAGPNRCDIVWFQEAAGGFAPSPPVPGVGPGSMSDPSEFVRQLADAGVDARVETEVTSFDFEDFDSAWEVLAGVTAAGLSPERRAEARRAVQAAMWPDAAASRHFRNATHFIVGTRTG